jgi:hypothetical protein
MAVTTQDSVADWAVTLTPLPAHIGPLKLNFYLWMDFNNFCKIIKNKVVFLFDFISTRSDQK